MALGVIFSSFGKALAQARDRSFRRVLWIGIGLTVALLVVVYATFLYFLQSVMGDTTTLPLIGEVTWINDLLGWSSFGLMLILSVFLMVPVASAITSLFLDEVAKAVEARHYPSLPPPPKMPWWDALRDTVNFLGVLIAANGVALMIYGFVPPLAPFIFWIVNGLLLGLEYFQLAAMRRIGRKAAKALRRRHLGTIWMAGILMAMPLSVPFVNLVIPILGAATFTHIYHRVAIKEGRV